MTFNRFYAPGLLICVNIDNFYIWVSRFRHRISRAGLRKADR